MASFSSMQRWLLVVGVVVSGLGAMIALLSGTPLVALFFAVLGLGGFAAALFHAMVNVTWQLFPNQGSHYDPRITGLIAAFAAVMVTTEMPDWGSRGQLSQGRAFDNSQTNSAMEKNTKWN